MVISERTNKFPKMHRHTIGKRIEDIGLDFMSSVFRANALYGKARIKTLAEASVTLDLLKTMIRMAHDMKALPEKGYFDLAMRANEVGKMLGGWIKSLQTPRPARLNL